ncbi:TetR/AcrR family transcriptional regulator [Pseudonocardia sp. KRD291]|uniref:TetR/AcrR family transcriptional regulator n=1 Tax=Pseudonocardia sp. KRD291 TaxID=2792007 RepID=UPI001C4A7362|nr:TetR/AcrR family transcriptional regulator [Pseudonocardia sp. KRD291]MBW0102286.1 helix-turn-helix transcriptional regulator [Pseudonocardia sp. KRD291]
MARPPSIDDDLLIDLIVSVFREKGFDGTAIGDLSAASGLQRASLYHRFPRGKEQMAEAALDAVGKRFGWILEPMREDPTVTRGVTETARRLGEFYGAGSLSCVLDTMTLAGAPPGIRDHARSLATAWIDAMTDASRRAGRRPDAAVRAAEDAFVRIEGALVLGRVTGNTGAFHETVALLPALLVPEGPPAPAVSG